MQQVRTASSTWSGDLLSGSGVVSSVSSGSFAGLPVSWAARTEGHGGMTSPEELLAAAHAACFSMAFSNGLAKNGTVATRLDITCAVTFEKGDAGWKVAQSALTVTGVVPGIDQATFAELADAAKDGCPISGALKGNVALTVKATLGAA
ncbi:MAG TPA: OsmC family peroxiredoxin [Candidatus Limnocylindrales bacterium]